MEVLIRLQEDGGVSRGFSRGAYYSSPLRVLFLLDVAILKRR
jgi:hypothetical protein